MLSRLYTNEQLGKRSVEGRKSNCHPEREPYRPLTPAKLDFIVEKMRQRVDLCKGDVKRFNKTRIKKIINIKCGNLRRTRNPINTSRSIKKEKIINDVSLNENNEEYEVLEEEYSSDEF